MQTQLPQSRYLSAFQALSEKSSTESSHVLVGDFLLVERIEDQELKTESGIILTAPVKNNQINGIVSDKPYFARVLLCGSGYYDTDTKESIPLDVSPGDIILVSQLSVKHFSVFGSLAGYKADSIGITRESEVQMRWKAGEEGWNTFFNLLNGAMPKQSAQS